jgi:hypothetical protein
MKKIKNYYLILILAIAYCMVGLLLGYLFFYFLKDQSVFLIDRFKFLQSLFGIYEYREGMSFQYVFLVIFFGNLISTSCYVVLGYLKTLIPMSAITGFFIMVFLLSGQIRHEMAIPASVILLSSIETFYRMLAIALGENFEKNRFSEKINNIVIATLILALFLFGVFYEISLIF